MHRLFSLLVVQFLYTINGLILPMTKTDGSLDVSSLLSHIALLEQSVENKASAADFNKLEQELKNELKSAQTKITILETKLDQCSCSSPGTQNSASPAEVKNLQTDMGHLKLEVFQLQSLHNRTSGTSTTGGSTYTRWGRTSCPADSTVVYKGYTGGTWFDDKGGSGSIVCLPDHPIYANHTPDHHAGTSHIYGTEFDSYYTGNPLQHYVQEDLPCVVCESFRSKNVMIPGRNACYPGWTTEYLGYLMDGLPTHASADYMCLDSDPEAVPGGQADKNGQTLFTVESHCGTLPCPPYENYWELTCVVCSK